MSERGLKADQPDLERLIERRVLRVNAGSFALATGLLSGLTVLLATCWLLLKGDPHPGPHLALLGQYFLGYRVTFAGSLIGGAYGFAVGSAAAYAGAWLYNRVVDLRHGKGEPR